MAITTSAYTVYWYDATGAGYGMAGRIVDAGVSVLPNPGMKIGLNGDPKVKGFIDTGNNLRIAVTDRVAGQSQSVFIHDATNGQQVGSAQTWPEDNLYTLVRLGNYLYAIDYDNAKVIEISATAPYAATGVSFSLASVTPSLIPPGSQACGQALIVLNGTLYGLFAFPDSTWSNYANSLLVRFAIAGSGTGRTISVSASNGTLAKNAFAVASDGTDLYVAAIGGKQTQGDYNENSRLQKINASLTTVTNVMSASPKGGTPPAFPYEFRDISFKGSVAYILAGAYDSNWNLRGKLFSTTDFSTLTNIDDFSSGAAVAGSFWSAQYTPDNDRLWYTRGNDIRIYNASNLTQVGDPLTVTVGSLIAQGDQYTDLNDLSYVGPAGGSVSLRGYRSPLQRSNTPFAQAARALTRGRPELTEEEFQQLAKTHGAP
ncbi:MAG: hypothetical protein LBJ59_08970 [Zoogloeaceae bacterium]|jgi:hypothetical protein|nr:hypothetical protein [Zoogloeaceae bacterium]